MRLAIATVDQTRELEASVMDAWGVPQLLLMERAALGAAHRVRALGTPDQAISVVCGTGNNGADGVACARVLSAWGYVPVVYRVPGKPAGALARQLEWAERWGIPVRDLPDALPGGVIVDAILGFGLARAPEGSCLEAIRLINGARRAAVVAIDLPSGIDGTTGRILSEAVRATETVACGVLKTGLLSDPALDSIGALWLADIGFPSAPLSELPGDVIGGLPLPARSRAAHKGSAGFTLVVGGAASMSGAPAMVSLAAGRIGAGLVYAAVPAGIRDVVASQMPEAVVLPLAQAEDGGLAPEAWDQLVPLLERCDAGVLGPGLGRTPGAREVAMRLAERWDRPLVVDADALQSELLARSPHPRVLTPHPGEASRMLGRAVPELQADRLSGALDLARRSGAVTVLKGARTVVAEPDGRYGINVHGHPVMATGGSGDVLAGMIGGLLAQGMSCAQAARLGVELHGRCGEAAARGHGHAILALDLLASLPEVLATRAGDASGAGELIRIGASLAP